MTDNELLSGVFAILDPDRSTARALHRSGRLLLALPEHPDAAWHTLRLYQPQRALARVIAALLGRAARLGSHRILLPSVAISHGVTAPCHPVQWADAGTCGVMLGSPEHQVRRAIASYRNGQSWEVAKISFGPGGYAVLDKEAKILARLGSRIEGAPGLLGFHHMEGASILRMPYLSGRRIPEGNTILPLGLLNSWFTSRRMKSITDFSEWPAIVSSLNTVESGCRLIETLSRETLRPTIRHGDFARWNLLQQDGGGLMALDWEWESEDGMPGLDLVHYFLQDARLVRRQVAEDAIGATLAALDRRECRSHLQNAGWSFDTMLPIIASLAFKQGAGHQENREILEAACGIASRRTTVK